MKKVIILIVSIIVLIIIGIVFLWMNCGINPLENHFEDTYELPSLQRKRYSNNFSSSDDNNLMDNVVFTNLGLIENNKIVCEVKNNNSEPVILEEINAILDDSMKISYNGYIKLFKQVSILPNEKTVLIFELDGNEINENSTFSFEAQLYDDRNNNIHYLDSAQPTFHDSQEVITACWKNDAGYQLKNIVAAMVFYKDNKPIYYSYSFHHGNLSVDGVLYNDFICPYKEYFKNYKYNKEYIDFDRYEYYILDAFYNKTVSRASEYLNYEFLKKESGDITIKIQNTSDYPIEADGIYLRCFDDNGNYCGCKYMGTLDITMGKSVVFDTCDSYAYGSVNPYDYSNIKIDIISPTFNMDYKDVFITNKVSNDLIKINYTNKSENRISYFRYYLIVYKDGVVVDLIGNWLEPEEDKKKSFTVDIEKPHDKVEVGFTISS